MFTTKFGLGLDKFGIREQSEEVVVFRLDTFGIREQTEEVAVVRSDNFEKRAVR